MLSLWLSDSNLRVISSVYIVMIGTYLQDQNVFAASNLSCIVRTARPADVAWWR